MQIKQRPFIRLCTTLLFSIIASTLTTAQTRVGDEYSLIRYNETATHNPIAQLNEQLSNGEVSLKFENPRGYLDSLLETLEISQSSQLLVFSKTSLQHKLISAATPRAIYFSENVYIGWVQGSEIIEILTIDAKLGPIFYIFNNTQQPKEFFERTNQSCLVCHDSAGTMGGGTPLLMSLSSVYSATGDNLKDISTDYFIRDKTPIKDRWGGWYVTGQSGTQKHLGNVLLPNAKALSNLDEALRTNIDSLADTRFFDTAPYPTASSDIVALLILEHQSNVQNQLAYIQFKAPAVLARLGLEEAQASLTWSSLPPRAQQILSRMFNELLQTLLMIGASAFDDSIHGSSDFTAWFDAQAQKDSLDRSLWDLDLDKQLFRYPLSFLIYSEAFNALPAYGKDYIYLELSKILQGQNEDPIYSEIATLDRQIILEILIETKTDFTDYLAP